MKPWDYITKMCDNGTGSHKLSLDLTKAFDSVIHAHFPSLLQEGFAVPEEDGDDLLPPQHIEEY